MAGSKLELLEIRFNTKLVIFLIRVEFIHDITAKSNRMVFPVMLTINYV